MQKANVFVIIVTYNAMKWVDRCLTSLRDSSVEVKPVVIDNCSTDETVSHIKKHYPEVLVIKNIENRGFGQANNQGIEYAYRNGATHFFLLNQDAWIHKDTLQKLVETQDDAQLGIVSPIHLNGQGIKIDQMFFEYTVCREHNNPFVSGLVLGTLSNYYEVAYVNAAAWLISRRVIEKVGGFDPLFFHYGEDSNYLQRLLFHKEKLAFVPNCYIHHDREEHGNEQSYKKRLYTRKLLMEFANINKSMLSMDKTRCKFLFYFFLETLSSLFTLKFKQFYNYCADFILFLTKIGIVIQSRKANRIIGSTWLDLR